MTYAALSLGVLVPVIVLSLIVIVRRRALVPVLVGLVALLVLTVVFDNVIVGAGIVAYAPDRISGLRIGEAPVEDFAYAIAAAFALPALWLLVSPRRPRR